MTFSDPTHRLLDSINASLLRIAEALEQSNQLKQKTRQNRTSAPLEYDPRFLAAWSAYPKRNGSNPKAAAYKSWRARIKAATNIDAEIAAMHDGTVRYAEWCEATNKTNTETVMQAQRFYGPSCEYDQPWTIVEQPSLIRVPYDLDALVKFGREHGIETRAGETKDEYRRRVEDHVAQSTL